VFYEMNDLEHTTDTAAQLSSLLGQFMAEVLRYDSDAMRRLLQREELSLARIGALNFVERRGSASISEISACLDLSLGNTSMLVDKLVCKGFVTRAEDASDRRHKLVQLTNKGQALITELRATRVNHVVQRMLVLPPELLAHTIDVLRDLNAQLSDIRVENNATPAVTERA
jgi:DNA-binding MarR family transcriptional regulator